MAYSRPVWNQLKGLTLKELAKALKRDGWIEESRAGATIGFIGPRLLTALLDDIGWSEDDLVRLKLIRKPSPGSRR